MEEEEEELSGASERPPPLNRDDFPSSRMSPLRRRNPHVVSLSENGLSPSLGGGEERERGAYYLWWYQRSTVSQRGSKT